MARRDDDALSWGDDDPTLDDGTGPADDEGWDDEPASAPPAVPPRPAGTVTATVTGADGTVSTREVVHPRTDDRRRPRAARPSSGEPAQLGNAAFVTLGVLGGVYGLFAVGWLIAGLRMQPYAILYEIEPIGYVVAWALAVLAPVLWFAGALALTRRRPVWQRMLPLVLGVLVLVPWPFLNIGGFA